MKNLIKRLKFVFTHKDTIETILEDAIIKENMRKYEEEAHQLMLCKKHKQRKEVPKHLCGFCLLARENSEQFDKLNELRRKLGAKRR